MMKLSIEVDSFATEAEMDLAIETLKKFKVTQAQQKEHDLGQESGNQNPEQAPNKGVTVVAPVVAPVLPPVAQVQPLEAGTIIYAPVTSPVAAYTATNTSPVVDAKGVPAMFSPEGQRIVEERKAMMSAKPAPIVAPFSTMSGPTVLPQKLNPALAPPNIPAGITPFFAPADPNVVVPFNPPMVR